MNPRLHPFSLVSCLETSHCIRAPTPLLPGTSPRPTRSASGRTARLTGHHGTASGLSGKERTSGTVSICNNLRRQLRLARRPRQRPNRLRSRRPAGDKTTGALALRPGHRRPVPERLLQCHTRQIRCRPYRPRTVAASPVPVDVLSTSDLTNQGRRQPAGRQLRRHLRVRSDSTCELPGPPIHQRRLHRRAHGGGASGR